ncbi:MAG: hypothetical protein LBJ10_08525 [Clostridiales bacterium]|jgi:hypothetical protein|nr:hypothetical protein [Clostridiales bacterium]
MALSDAFAMNSRRLALILPSSTTIMNGVGDMRDTHDVRDMRDMHGAGDMRDMHGVADITDIADIIDIAGVLRLNMLLKYNPNEKRRRYGGKQWTGRASRETRAEPAAGAAKKTIIRECRGRAGINRAEA